MPRCTAGALACAVLLALTPGEAGGKGPEPEPDPGPDPRGLTISGTGVALVRAPEQRTEATIERAVDAARPAALRRAVAQARERAARLAAGAGLTLGTVAAVTERDAEAEGGFGGRARHCVAARRRGRPVRRCTVPLLASATVSVTFATAQTDLAVPAGRFVVASAVAAGAVAPRDRRDSASIRAAILAARLAAAPRALAEARADAQAAARAAGLPAGALFSVAEVRRPYDDGSGSFAPGRFCGTVREGIFRRVPGTGRRRLVRRVSRVRCFFPRESAVILRVTLLPAT